MYGDVIIASKNNINSIIIIIIIIIIITIIHMEIPGSWMEKVSSYSRITEFIVVYHIV